MLGLTHPPRSTLARERFLGRSFDVVAGTYYTFDTVWRNHPDDLVPAAGRTLMVCWMPQSAFRAVLLSEIVAGRYDEHIDQMLSGMRQVPGPVVCRLAHEANGSWYPWASAFSGRRAGSAGPEEYVAAWRHVVERERRMRGRSNITWLWCQNGEDHPSPTGEVHALESYWPGAEWVDAVGCDVYNDRAGWRSFDELLAVPYARITSLSDKPFWVGETGCREPRPGEARDKAQWVVDLLTTTRFPQLRCVCYFDIDARARGRSDWRLDSSPQTLTRVRAALQEVA